jgi:hypothetical protein
MTIFHPELKPLSFPEAAPQPTPDSVFVRYNADGSIIQEIFRRQDGTFGFRYQAWVNFADAGGNPHHLWHEFLPQSNSITDTIASAKELAEFHAAESKISFGEWEAAQPGDAPDAAAPFR